MSRRRSVLGSRSNFNSRRGMASPRGFLWFPAARCPILSRGTSFKWPKNTSTWRLRGPTKRKPKSTSVGIFRREARTHGGGTKSAMIRAHRRIARSTRVTAGMCAPAGLDVPGKTNAPSSAPSRQSTICCWPRPLFFGCRADLFFPFSPHQLNSSDYLTGTTPP